MQQPIPSFSLLNRSFWLAIDPDRASVFQHVAFPQDTQLLQPLASSF